MTIIRTVQFQLRSINNKFRIRETSLRNLLSSKSLVKVLEGEAQTGETSGGKNRDHYREEVFLRWEQDRPRLKVRSGVGYWGTGSRVPGYRP